MCLRDCVVLRGAILLDYLSVVVSMCIQSVLDQHQELIEILSQLIHILHIVEQIERDAIAVDVYTRMRQIRHYPICSNHKGWLVNVVWTSREAQGDMQSALDIGNMEHMTAIPKCNPLDIFMLLHRGAIP